MSAVEAVYEHGVLKPKAPLELREGETVDVIVLPRETGTNGRTRTNPAVVLAEIASLPLEGEPDGFSGQDHDRALYGDRQA